MTEVVSFHGFRESDTTGCLVTLYRRDRLDPIARRKEGTVVDFERAVTGATAPSLISCDIDRSLGSPSGSFNLSFKVPKGSYQDFFRELTDDDWVDISFTKFGRVYHKMRGLIDSPRRTRSVGGSGATVETWTITGRSWGKLYEVTPIYFNQFTDLNVLADLDFQIFGSVRGVMGFEGGRATAIERMLFGFFEAAEASQIGRSLCLIPEDVPNTLKFFADSVKFDASQISNFPPRVASNPISFLEGASGNLWSWIQPNTDPDFTEMIFDEMPGDDPEAPDYERLTQPTAPEDSWMQIIYREKPFPTLAQGLDSPYYRLPQFEVTPQDIVHMEVGKSGAERFNLFQLSSRIWDSRLDQAPGIQIPMYAPNLIETHGVRRYDVDTQWGSRDGNTEAFTKPLLVTMRDWYAISASLLNGTVQFGNGRPEVRIGSVLRINDVGSAPQETYYIEGERQSWRFGSGLRTELMLTRGWIGTDSQYIDAMQKMANEFVDLNRLQPVSDFGIG